MNGPTSLAPTEKSLPAKSDDGAEPSKLVEQHVPKDSHKIERDIDRIRSSLARLTSSSIDGLEGLTSELQELQGFLKSEVERVHTEIESALAGIKIILETIAPWKSNPASLTSPTNSHVVRAGPAANVHRSAGGKA
jgi:hypothetical protein